MPVRIMGIVNATPDSFYAPSRAQGEEAAVRRGLELAEQGADILDVGGESTRPGSERVSEDDELRRVVPVIERLARESKVPVSVDTSKAAVARRARQAGAVMLNDVAALRGPGMAWAATEYPEVIMMHMQGEPGTMQEAPAYGDVVGDILDFFRARLECLAREGRKPDGLYLDPGIGFGKTTEHNLDILRRLEEFHVLNRPLALGTSRKAFIGRVLGGEETPLPAQERLEGSLATACRAAQAGVSILRVHDVMETKKALRVFEAVIRTERSPQLAHTPVGGVRGTGT